MHLLITIKFKSMKIKLFAILIILTCSIGVKAQSLTYLDSNEVSQFNSTYGTPSTNYSNLDYCICLDNYPSYGGWAGQYDKSFISGGDGATKIDFTIRMDENEDRVIIYEDPTWTNVWVPKAYITGYGFQYYTTYNISSGYYGPVLVRIIKSSIDDFSDGLSEWDFHYLRGLWWYPYN